MENITLHELISAVQGEFLLGNPHAPVKSISIDSRTIRRGDYYFALKGNNFDGHDFLKHAVEKGAAGIIISNQAFDLGNPFPSPPNIVRVKDTSEALRKLAAYYRKKWDVVLIGVTGSNGKTTTKEMIASILEQMGPTLKNTANFNNHIGLPMTLFNLNSKHKFAVIEMGTSSPGEIKTLAEIAMPSIGVITNIGLSHLENLKSPDGILYEKKALLEILPEHGTAVINSDDPMLKKIIPGLRPKLITAGFNPEAMVRANSVTAWPELPSFELKIDGKSAQVSLPVIGEFNIYNALCAAAACWELSGDIGMIKSGLEKFIPPKMRMEVTDMISGITIVNDAYNANPSSMRQSVKGLIQAYPDREKILVLGDMLELGPAAESEHSSLGQFLSGQPVSQIFLYGPLMENACKAMNSEHTRHFYKMNDLINALENRITPHSVVFFKASRGMKLETALEKILSGKEELL